MKRGLLLFLAGILLIIIAGCSSKEYNTFVSHKNEYTLHYPAGWRVIDDKQKLNDATKQLLDKVGKFLIEPDLEVVFISKDGIGLVSKFLAPESVTSKQTLDSLESFVKSETREQDIDTRKINGKDFLIITENIMDMTSVTAYCLGDHDIYAFQFACPEDKSTEWEPKFSAYMNSISFQESDINQAKKEATGTRRGFLTGLWHGYLIVFRWIAVSIWSFDLYAKNSGWDYTVGFIIGVLFFVSHIVGAHRKH